MTNTIYTVGYQRWSVAQLQQQCQTLGAKLLDIRFSPKSQRAEWQGSALRQAFGTQYRHEPGLGNKNYKGGEIELAAPGPAMDRVEVELQAQPVVMLCVCANVETCHRKVAAEFLAEWLGNPIVHLDVPGKVMPAEPTSPLTVIRDADQRFFLRMYLRSNMDADQEIARERCLKHGIDYEAARTFVRRDG